jgi:hypothetical protein
MECLSKLSCLRKNWSIVITSNFMTSSLGELHFCNFMIILPIKCNFLENALFCKRIGIIVIEIESITSNNI